jgi:hypothetical protein
MLNKSDPKTPLLESFKAVMREKEIVVVRLELELEFYKVVQAGD